MVIALYLLDKKIEILSFSIAFQYNTFFTCDDLIFNHIMRRDCFLNTHYSIICIYKISKDIFEVEFLFPIYTYRYNPM